MSRTTRHRAFLSHLTHALSTRWEEHVSHRSFWLRRLVRQQRKNCRHSTAVYAAKWQESGGPTNVWYGSKADIVSRPRHVRFTPDSGRSTMQLECPLCAISGHLRLKAQLATSSQSGNAQVRIEIAGWITARAVPEPEESRDEQGGGRGGRGGRSRSGLRLAAEHLGSKGISVLTSRRRASRRYG